MGPVGMGKTTFINKLKTITHNISIEPINYWGKWLEIHLKN